MQFKYGQWIVKVNLSICHFLNETLHLKKNSSSKVAQFGMPFEIKTKKMKVEMPFGYQAVNVSPYKLNIQSKYVFLQKLLSLVCSLWMGHKSESLAVIGSSSNHFITLWTEKYWNKKFPSQKLFGFECYLSHFLS